MHCGRHARPSGAAPCSGPSETPLLICAASPASARLLRSALSVVYFASGVHHHSFTDSIHFQLRETVPECAAVSAATRHYQGLCRPGLGCVCARRSRGVNSLTPRPPCPELKTKMMIRTRTHFIYAHCGFYHDKTRPIIAHDILRADFQPTTLKRTTKSSPSIYRPTKACWSWRHRCRRA